MAMLSEYAEDLDISAKTRYREKLNGNVCSNYSFPDPYAIPKESWINNVEKWPPVEFSDIYAYLMYSKCDEFDAKTLKNYRSLSAYEYVKAGKVHCVYYYAGSTSDFCLLTADVQRSQSINDKDHKPWVIIASDGSVITAHCTCMAGLGEACSHVAALLFKIQQGTDLKKLEPTPTDLPCKWNCSFSSKKVPCATVDQLDLSKSNWDSKVKRRRISFNPIQNLPAYTKDELQELKIACPEAVCLNLMDSSGSSDGSAADNIHEDAENLPPSIIEAVRFIKEGNVKDELLKIYSSDVCHLIEARTVGQSSCPLWIEQRRGRFTSSIIKGVLKRKTWDDGFIKKLFMPAANIPSEPLQWGKDNEATAISCYAEQMECQHVNFSIRRCGLFINSTMPHLAASPDAVCKCDCCGEGIVEVKCPFKHKDKLIDEIHDKLFCLHSDGTLKKNHQYYYQVCIIIVFCAWKS